MPDLSGTYFPFHRSKKAPPAYRGHAWGSDALLGLGDRALAVDLAIAADLLAADFPALAHAPRLNVCGADRAPGAGAGVDRADRQPGARRLRDRSNRTPGVRDAPGRRLLGARVLLGRSLRF